MIDLRPLQEPDRAPITAHYLERLLGAFAARPLPGESFVVLLRSLREDPSDALASAGLPVAGRRRLPPTSRMLRSAGLTLDSFLLRGAEIGTIWDADPSTGALFHTAGGAVPLGSSLPVVATLLDLAPWELPELYARNAAARFGHRLRARVLRDATRLIVTSRATAETARRRIHIRPERIVIVPLAADAAFSPAALDDAPALRARLDLPERYLLFAGRYDARKDFATLFTALGALREEGPPGGSGVGDESPWPPLIVLAGGAGAFDDEDRYALARAVERRGVTDLVRLTRRLETPDLAALVAGARGLVFPCLSEGTGLPALEAVATGTPVIASKVGALPENVGGAGIIVEPANAARLAAALRALWTDDRLHGALRAQAIARASGPRRTWHDVATETRQVYAAAAAARGAR